MLDQIDDQLHDLLMQRAALVEASGEFPPDGSTILRRLVDRHLGPLAFGAVARIWRELLGAGPAPERPSLVAVFNTESLPGLWDLARDQYGSQVPMIGYRSAGQVIHAVSDGTASIGVLPMPAENEDDPWWRQIVSRDPAAPRVVARLPFAGRGNARSAGEALALARGAAEADVLDRTLLAIEFSPDTSRTRLAGALSAAGFDGRILAVDTPDGAAMALADAAGVVAKDDPRLEDLAAQLSQKRDGVYRLGFYAEPLPTRADNHNAPIRIAS